MTDRFTKVTQTILKKYKTSKKEHDIILKKIDGFLHEIRIALEHTKIEAYVMLGGSAAKGTFLKHDFDCDIFVRFQFDKYKDKDLSNLLEPALKKIKNIKYERVHGSRDYFTGKWKDLHYEIIPVLYITNKNMAKNITDMSPLHVEWLNQHINEELRDQILFTKLFFKAQKVYGAESYMNGFSGHVVDLLTVYYGSFKALLENIEKWQEKELINMTPHPININALNPDKLQSAIIIIDPVQSERNAAAAVSYEQFYTIKNQAGAFLANPTIDFFKRKNINTKDIAKIKKDAIKRGAAYIILKVLPAYGKLDTIGTKIFKSYEYMKEELEKNEFHIEESGWGWEEDQEKPAWIWILIKEKKLPAITEQQGPPLKLQKNIRAFRAKHKEVFFKGERLYAKVKRKYPRPQDVIKAILKDKRIKEKARKWTIVR